MSEEAPQKYLFKKCSTLNCHVMIGWAVGSLQGHSICKWCQEGKAYYADGTANDKFMKREPVESGGGSDGQAVGDR